ncbi:MAG: glutamine-hydrolyzing GMP synthase, partial [Endomicrobium sp.]|nr:glutamine-hydrolyzing GMP synthase [Endomicrobium sp.]
MILILDFGSQYTQLIARRIREENVYCEIYPGNKNVNIFLKHKNLDGIILSGSYDSVCSNGFVCPDDIVWNLGVPILGICYGMQLIAKYFGGKVIKSEHREFGIANIKIKNNHLLFNGLNLNEIVWMSHGDRLFNVPKSFDVIAESDNHQFAAIQNIKRNIYGVQFHPEVNHTVNGRKILKNFLFKICNSKKNWTIKSYIVDEIKKIKEEIKNRKVLCAMSGGVDSSVAAMMLYKAIGKQLICIYIDHGLQRVGETD